MLGKIQLIQTRIAELEEMLYKARNGKSYADIKWLEGLLVLNNRILAMLKNGYPIQFYPLQFNDEHAKGFFLTKDDIAAPFVNVWN